MDQRLQFLASYQKEEMSVADLCRAYGISRSTAYRWINRKCQSKHLVDRSNPPLKFDGGGYVAGGKAMFDSECNLWVGDNCSVRWQGQDSLRQGNATKFTPNGKPLSPITTGFAGGGK